MSYAQIMEEMKKDFERKWIRGTMYRLRIASGIMFTETRSFSPNGKLWNIGDWTRVYEKDEDGKDVDDNYVTNGDPYMSNRIKQWIDKGGSEPYPVIESTMKFSKNRTWINLYEVAGVNTKIPIFKTTLVYKGDLTNSPVICKQDIVESLLPGNNAVFDELFSHADIGGRKTVKKILVTGFKVNGWRTVPMTSTSTSTSTSTLSSTRQGVTWSPGLTVYSNGDYSMNGVPMRMQPPLRIPGISPHPSVWPSSPLYF
jgi:hypothetical protein